MRALTLQQGNVAQQQQQQQQHQATCGTSLSSNYAPLNLENKFLAQTSTLMPLPRSPPLNLAAQPSLCPSLQPSSLSSTSSSLFSASSLSSLSSPLLSTQNKLLHSRSLTAVPDGSLLSTSSSSLLNRFAQPLSFLRPDLCGEQKRDEEGEESPEVIQSCFDETSVTHTEEDVALSEEEEEDEEEEEEEEEEEAMDEDDAGKSSELAVLEAESGNQELEQMFVVRQEEFAEVNRDGDKIKEELHDRKYLLLNAVCSSLVNKSTAPGQKDWNKENTIWTRITNLAKDISDHDPQFLLKVSVYTRQQLNIRITANFLLALAANLPSTKPHVRRYFCAAVQLPSDWLEVVRLYSTCFSPSLPMCLKKSMADKFKQFSEYQLAKYNTRKHRCKHNRNRQRAEKPNKEQLKEWANLLRTDATILSKFLQLEKGKKVVDKKQSEFSIKKMIKRFHIKEPAEHVMAILGKKYPADLKTFTRSGMKGAWERERAGQRMKLKQPETWERLLSLEGNKAATWEKLIDNKSLPFMAMLRNLRNMITKGISEAHHNKILSRLTNKKAVTQSRQFPFRFLTAYKVIMELHALASVAQQELPPVHEILKGILNKIPKGKRFSQQDWDTTERKRIRVALGVPFVYRLYRMKKTQLLKANETRYTVALLDRYRRALEAAVQISCRYNVPPLPGRTVILLSSNMQNFVVEKQDFCLPPDPQQKEEEEEEETCHRRRRRGENEEDKLSASVMETAVLLSLMIASSAEDCQIHLINWNCTTEVKLESDVLLDNVRSVMKQIKKSGRRSPGETFTFFAKNKKVDNIIVLSGCWMDRIADWAVGTYRKDVNNKALLVEIALRTDREGEYSDDRNCVSLSGFSDQLLRFVAERGSSRLLDHVEHLDKVYNIPPPEGAKQPRSTDKAVAIPASPKLSWRGVRVFISSTFRDMHAERDILVQSVFPELRRRAASHCLYLQEVELRWGVTEEESGRATELCLSEVCRSQMMVVILGERYGLVPPTPRLPDLPQHSWLSVAPPSLSVTEMEIRQFQALYLSKTHQRMFCYFRDPNVLKSIPVAWSSHFVPESKEAESKMAALKKRIRTSEIKVTENYPCEWGGVVDGRPHLKNLEVFGKAVLEDLWAAVVKQFVQDEAEAEADVSEQEVHQGALQRQFFGREKPLVGAVEMVEQVQAKGGLVVVEGGDGDGKSVFMAALADALRTGVKSKNGLVCDVISYSTAASQSAPSVENLLQCLVQCLRKMKDAEGESALPHSYKDLLSELNSRLSNEEEEEEKKRKRPLVLLVDGVDLVRDGRGQRSSDWMPQQLPPGVCLVVSLPSKAALFQTLAKKKSSVLLVLGPLNMSDRREIVQKGLDTFGKKLSDSAFNNQLQTLIMKKGAVSPLYLHLACEHLRNFASFDKLKESLDALPPSLSQLVQCRLDRLCSQFRGLLGLRWALAALALSSTGLRETDLCSVLNTCSFLSSRDGRVTWQETLRLSREPRRRVPMATFTRLVQSLKSLIGPSRCPDTDDRLTLTNPDVRRAFEDFLLPADGDRSRAHLVLAAHLWASADQRGTDTFLHCEASSVTHLPSHLIQSGQLEALYFLLCSYYFLYANVRHGLLHHLLDTYSAYNAKHHSASFGPRSRLEDCWSFLQRHVVLLSSWPALCVQQALNEPAETSAHIWAQGLVGKRGVRVVEWLNKDTRLVRETGDLLSTFPSKPTCVVLSSDEQLMAVGTGQGTLHVITESGQEVKSLVSSCDGISSCVFLKDGRLAATSFDGRIEIWDVENGCRTALIEAHTNVITASHTTADRKHLATASLDSTLKVWSASKGHEVAALLLSSPLNCVTFDPEGRLLAAGCWNGDVAVWNWLQNETLTPLSGHRSSVRSLSFTSSSSMLCSGSMSGEVRVWSVPTSTCVGCFQAHSGATEALAFLDEGNMLLSAGSDHMLHLWSDGLGRLVSELKSEQRDAEPPLKKRKSAASEPAALCVAVNGDYAAVGYHGDGIKLFSLDPAEVVWAPEHLDVSVLCLLWVVVDAEKTEPELLLSAGSDKRVRSWKRKEGEEGLRGGLEMLGLFAATGVVQVLAQNSTYLATASDDGRIHLWLLSDLLLGSGFEPHALLKGHSGGVTCLAFSPDGAQLLSGGRDQALMLWDVNASPAVLSKALPHSHRDWITGCVWTPDCVISSSNDGRLCLWDLESGQRLREISWSSSLTSVCCVGRYVIAGCAEGALHVWTWETSVEICHIAAHQQRIHHCSVLPSTDETKEVNPEEMTVFSASDDGSVKLWKPLQVEHFSTFQGHSGAICGVSCKQEIPEFLSVSEDCSLRCWPYRTVCPPTQRGSVTALCFSRRDALLLAGYESGLLELWQHSSLVGQKQTSGCGVAAICSMPDHKFAVSYTEPAVDVFKVVWNQQHDNASLVKVVTHRGTIAAVRLYYCTVLMGVSRDSKIYNMESGDDMDWTQAVSSWELSVRILGLIPNDEKSMWLVGDKNGEVQISIVFAMGPKYRFHSAFGNMSLETDDEEEKGSVISAVTVNNDFVVCGDVKGNMWFIQPPAPWSRRKPVHGDKISVLRLTERYIISASYDRTLKLWDRSTKKQVGMFVCGAPVVQLEVNPEDPTEMVCSDTQGKLYFLSWKE